MFVKFIMSVALFFLWSIAGISIQLGAYFLVDEADAPGAIFFVIIAIGIWFFGRWLHKKFRLGYTVCWVIATVMLLFNLIMLTDDWSVFEHITGFAATFAFAVHGFVIYRNNHRLNESISANTASFANGTLTNMNNVQLSINQQYLRRLNIMATVTKDMDVKNEILHLHMVAKQILDFVDTNPDHAYKVDLFIEHYLPKTVELLERYAEFIQKPVKTIAMYNAINNISASIARMKQIYEHTLDSLYSDIVTDIGVDIEVLEQMMKLDGIDE